MSSYQGDESTTHTDTWANIPTSVTNTTAGSIIENDILDDIQVELQYDTQGNLESGDYKIWTCRSDNLPAYIRGKAEYHKWTFAPGNSYEVPFEGQSQECEFINRRWYWIEWDNQRNNGEGCYTFNPTEDCIISPKDHGLGTEEDHYRELKSEEDLDKGDESSESSKETDSSKDKEHTPVAVTLMDCFSHIQRVLTDWLRYWQCTKWPGLIPG